MNEAIVVDVGNTRVKWGRCKGDRVLSSASLPPDDEPAWQAQWEGWELRRETPWIVTGVHPPRRDRLVAWLRQRSDHVQTLILAEQLPLKVVLDAPDRVGIDRLLTAVAANRRRAAGSAAVLVNAGTAVTVDYVNRDGAFRGGAIFPGLRLMAQALHDYTALLPIIRVEQPIQPPGSSTIDAMCTGIYHAALGGIERLISEYSRASAGPTEVYLTGGDAPLLAKRMLTPAQLWPEMTLEGIMLSRQN